MASGHAAMAREFTLADFIFCSQNGRPRLKAMMEYVVTHQEEFNKVALVQRKVRYS